MEHSYGHGKKYLTTVLAIIMFLTFLVDQIAQHLDLLLQKAWNTAKSKKGLWERVKNVFYMAPVLSMSAIFKFIIRDKPLDIAPLE